MTQETVDITLSEILSLICPDCRAKLRTLILTKAGEKLFGDQVDAALDNQTKSQTTR